MVFFRLIGRILIFGRIQYTLTLRSNVLYFRYCVTIYGGYMAQTNAQRQAAYREKRLRSEESPSMRLNYMIGLHSKNALERLASCYCVTQQEMIEKLISDAERALFKKMKISAEDQTKYYDKTLKLKA